MKKNKVRVIVGLIGILLFMILEVSLNDPLWFIGVVISLMMTLSGLFGDDKREKKDE